MEDDKVTGQKISKNRLSSQGPARPGSGSLFALYTVPVSYPGGGIIRPGIVLEDPRLMENFVTDKLAKQLGLPSEPLFLSIRMLKDQYRHN